MTGIQIEENIMCSNPFFKRARYNLKACMFPYCDLNKNNKIQYVECLLVINEVRYFRNKTASNYNETFLIFSKSKKYDKKICTLCLLFHDVPSWHEDCFDHKISIMNAEIVAESLSILYCASYIKQFSSDELMSV